MTMIIAEIGINHNGDMSKARWMLRDIALTGCLVAKFQCHIPDAEMIPHAAGIVPSNADENIYDMMARCAFTEKEERELKQYAESLGLTYLCTPFSREAADRLERMGVTMYKIGSGECNNYPLIRHIAAFGKPIILSTGMNDFDSIDQAVEAVGNCPLKILHCVSMYPTPYEAVNLPRMLELKERYHVPVGLSDHSVGIFTALAAVALGAEVVEKHFVSDRSWPGPDVPISICPDELQNLVVGAEAIEKALQSNSPADSGTKEFALASIVSTRSIRAGMKLNRHNIWVKRPAGGIPAAWYDSVLGFTALCDIPVNEQIQWEMIDERR